MTRLFTCFALVCLFLAHPVFAQNGTITGTARDATTGETLSGVNVVLLGTSIGSATNPDGVFRISNVPDGQYTLSASFIGFNTYTVPVEVNDGGTVTVEIAMEERLFQGEEIVVSGSLRPEKLTDTPATIELITAADVQFIPAYSAGELLARLKGVDYFRAGIATPAINVRGFNSNFNAKNLQVTDGRYSTLIATGLPFGPLDTVSPEDIERQEVVLGPNGALFGPNAHNGLVNTITKDPRTSQGTIANVRGGSQSTFAANLRHAQVASDRLAFKVNLDYARADEFAFADSVYIDRNGDGVKEGYEEYKLDNGTEFLKGSAALYYSLTDDTDLVFNYGGSNSTYLSPTNVGRNQIIDWRIHVFQARFVSPKFFAQAYHSLSRTDDTYSIDQRTKNYYAAIDAGMSEAQAEEASLGNEAIFEDASRRWNAEGQYRDQIAGFDVVAGVQWQRDMANSNGTYLLDEDEDDFITIDQIGGYGQVARDFGAGFRGVVAFRADDHEVYGFNLLPKVGLLRIGERGTWRLTYGKGIAAPTILNMYGKLFGGLILGNAEGFTVLDFDAQGNIVGTKEIAKQEVEELQTIELGYKGQVVQNRLFVDANAYYNISKNFLSPLTVLGVATHRGETPIDEVQPLFNVYGGLVASYVNFGEFNTYGADIGLTALLVEDLTATLNYSYFDLSFDENDLENNDFNGDGVVNKLDHLVNAPTHKASLGFNYNGPKFFGTAFFRWVEAYDYFSSFQIAAETQDLVYRGLPVVEDARGADSYNYGPLGGFMQVDVGAGYKVNQQVRVTVQVTNLFDSEIREFTAAPFIDRLISAGVRVEL